MSIELPEPLENVRKNDLRIEKENYDRRMKEKYPETLWSYAAENAEHQLKHHSDELWGAIVKFIIVEVIILYIFNGFEAGFAAAIALSFFVFYLHEHRKNEPNVLRLEDPRSDEDLQEGIDIDRRIRNPDIDREQWAAKSFVKLEKNSINREIFEEREIEKIKKAEEFFANCPIPYEQYQSGPALIFSLIKVLDKDNTHDENIVRVKIEEISADGSWSIIEDREYEGWPVSWSRDDVCFMGLEKGLPVFGRDIIEELK